MDLSAQFPSKKVSPNHKIESDGETQELPKAIITEILGWLPVKSLLKFKSVSKSWLCLISSSRFVDTHLEKSTKDAGLSNYRILISPTLPYFELKRYPLFSFMSKSCIMEPITDYPGKEFNNYVYLAGSVNGLVFIEVEKQHLFLWNPSTRVSKTLPDPNVLVERIVYEKRIWGLGFNESDGDYKVIGIFCLKSLHKTLVRVYSLRTNSWKRIESFEGYIPIDNRGKYVNGKLDYYTYHEGHDNIWSVLSLYLNSETYGLVEQPSCWNYLKDHCCIPSLELLGGCLSSVHNFMNTCVDVWVLRQYGVKESWTKLITIPFLEDSPVPKGFQWTPAYQLCMLPNGEIVLINFSSVITYNPETRSFRHHQPSHLKAIHGGAAIYVESLVSPVMLEG